MNKNQYNKISKLRDRLFEESEQLIISTLKAHGGRVTHPLKEQFLEGGYEQSDTYPLDTDNGSSNIRITDLYLGEFDFIYADGVGQEFNLEQNGLQLIDHQYEFALEFLNEVPGFKPLHFSIGQPVIWTDPEGISSGRYTVLDNFEEKYKGLTDEDLREADDRIILIGNGTSQAEVPYNELDYVRIKKQLWGIVYTIKEHSYRSQSFQSTYHTKEEAETNMYKDIMADYKAADSIQELKSLVCDEKVILIDEWEEIEQ